MTIEEKKEHVENILKGADLFDDLVAHPHELLHYRPEPDRWTIHEHVIHCLDVDIANFTRYRVGIVHPGAEIIGMDDEWTEKLRYETIGIDEAIQTIKLIRRLTHSHFSTIIDEDWTEFSFLYKKYGNLNFEVFAPVFYRHPLSHREMIDKILDNITLEADSLFVDGEKFTFVKEIGRGKKRRFPSLLNLLSLFE